MESQLDSISMQGSHHIPTPERKPSLTRSQTDSNITYVVEEISEAPGSFHYITKEGDIDLQVVLKVTLHFTKALLCTNRKSFTSIREQRTKGRQSITLILFIFSKFCNMIELLC